MIVNWRWLICFDIEIDLKSLAGVLEHIEKCPDCANEYHEMEETLSFLKPKTQLNAPIFA